MSSSGAPGGPSASGHLGFRSAPMSPGGSALLEEGDEAAESPSPDPAASSPREVAAAPAAAVAVASEGDAAPARAEEAVFAPHSIPEAGEGAASGEA